MKTGTSSYHVKLLIAATLAFTACRPSVEAAPSHQHADQVVPVCQPEMQDNKSITSAGHDLGAPGYRKSYFRCLEAARGTIENATCMSDEMNYQDERLNKNYATLMRLLDAKGKQVLLDAQRSWIELKEKDGRVDVQIFERDGSSVGNLQSMEADLERIARRADQLGAYAQYAQ